MCILKLAIPALLQHTHSSLPSITLMTRLEPLSLPGKTLSMLYRTYRRAALYGVRRDRKSAPLAYLPPLTRNLSSQISFSVKTLTPTLQFHFLSVWALRHLSTHRQDEQSSISLKTWGSLIINVRSKSNSRPRDSVIFAHLS